MSLHRVRLADDRRRDLEEERDFLLRSLDDLERERAAGELSDRDYLALRADYTARAAEAIRRLEGTPPRAAPAEPPPRPRPRRWRRLAVGAGVAAFAVVAGVAVASSSGSRLPGQATTGDIRPSTAQQLDEAAALAERGEVLEAIKRYDDVLAEDPGNVRAMTAKGWLLAGVGDAGGQPVLVERGMALLEEAVATAPADAEARFFYGLALLQVLDHREAALEQFRAVLANDPPPELAGPAQMVVRDLEAGGDGRPDGPPTP